MDKSQEPPKKCYCARCFLPIDDEDKVDVDGQNFHKICSMCCICRTMPTSLKMFYGHVFCNECFKNHVLTRFRGEAPRMHSNSWWMQWAPGAKPQEKQEAKDEKENDTKPAEQQLPKKCICARCLGVVEDNNKVEIGDQSFHTQCAKCCVCHAVPTSNVKIYYGQVFCEECFHRHVLNRNKDNPSEFFKGCFEQWQASPQFADNMKTFMAGNKDNTPFVFMMQGSQPPFCRCGAGAQEWFQTEPKKSATLATLSVGDSSLGTWDLSFENRTEASDIPEWNESANQENLIVAAAEKIEKLTKYLYDRDNDVENLTKKWKNFDYDAASVVSIEPTYGCINLESVCKREANCPKCLWQCGPIYVNSEYFQKEVYCGENSFE